MKIPQEEIDEAVRLYRQGLTLRQVGERMHLSAPAVRQRLVRAGEPRRANRGRRLPLQLPPSAVYVTARLYEEGHSAIEIAALLGITPRAVRRRLHRSDVPLRSLSEAATLRHARRREAA